MKISNYKKIKTGWMGKIKEPKFLFGENFRKDLDKNGWSMVCMILPNDDHFYLGAVTKELLKKGEKSLVKYLKSKKAWKDLERKEKDV